LVAHLDHGLRDDSSADAAFVQEQAARLDVECVTERAQVREFARTSHRSLEDAGRRVRYGFFERVCRERGCDVVAVGHTADDQAETVLFGILRGGGLDAVAGMPRDRPLSRAPGAPRLIRPLLGVWRDEITAYCERFDVQFVEDA